MQLTSPSFKHNNPLPLDCTCKGRGVNPPLTVSDVPSSTKSLALIMHDPDAVGGQDFLHWSLWGISPDTPVIAENSVPKQAIQGMNDYPNVAYGPACPPPGTGTHRYVFDLYALDTALELPEGTDRQTLEETLKGHILATAQLIGIVES